MTTRATVTNVATQGGVRSLLQPPWQTRLLKVVSGHYYNHRDKRGYSRWCQITTTTTVTN